MSSDHIINVPRGKFVQLLVVAENDDGHVDGAEDGQLMRFLEQTTFAFEKGAVIIKSGRWLSSKGSMTYTERFRSSLMALISIFLLPIVSVGW